MEDEFAMNTDLCSALLDGWEESTLKIAPSNSHAGSELPPFESLAEPFKTEPSLPTATTKLHPQGIPSSAECPPHNTMTVPSASSMAPAAASAPAPTASVNPLLIPSSSNPINTVTNTSENAVTMNVPPFLLFDAPMELRANFLQSQRAHGLPVVPDNNSFHYSMASTGFHPQQLQLLDARHVPNAKRVKNAKEQKRAQQITKLIDELREKMEKDGWKVELKSKFHTLSSCADYVRHLVKSNKEKEKKVAQAKRDLEAKRKLMQEDKAQDPSDPESTTSELTESSAEPSRKRARVSAESSDRSSSSVNISEVSYDTEKQKGSTFEIDFEEVFLKSSIPQLLASQSGRLLHWNELFCKASGLTDKAISQMTIFSLVQARHLADLFSTFANAIKEGTAADDSEELDKEQPAKIEEFPEYEYITVPCVPFPGLTEFKAEHLYMTVTVMMDDDPRKRCFHCAFTDNPGKNGNVGSITPELLSFLFAKDVGKSDTRSSLDYTSEGKGSDSS